MHDISSEEEKMSGIIELQVLINFTSDNSVK